jgi:rubrerythrin
MYSDILKKGFEEILVHEERARHFYDHYIEQIEDHGIRDVLISIRDEEIAHIKLAKKLLEYVS